MLGIAGRLTFAAPGAPPPASPDDLGDPAVSPWIPVNSQPVGSGNSGCGNWWWQLYRPMMSTTPVPRTSVPFEPAATAGGGTQASHTNGWSVDALLAQPEIAAILSSGQSARVSLFHGESRLWAIVSRPTTKAGSTLRFGPIWVISAGGLPPIDPELRMLPFAMLAESNARGEHDSPREEDTPHEHAPLHGTRDGTHDGRHDWIVQPSIAAAFSATNPPQLSDATCPPPAELDDPSIKLYLAWDDRTSARIHWHAVDGLRLARAIAEEAPIVDGIGMVDAPAKLEPDRARLHGMAIEWLREPLPPMPACGSPLVAYVELVDARQSVMRALGQVGDADTLTAWIVGRLNRASMHTLAARVAERVPPATVGFGSYTFHPCWLADTGEITAAASRLWHQQTHFCADLLAEVRLIDPCDARLTDALKEQFEWLIGKLPDDARVDEAARNMLRERIRDFCEYIPPAMPVDPLIVKDFAMTIALAAWTVAWTADGAQDPSVEDARFAWQELIVAKVGEALLREPFLSELPAEERPILLEEITRVVAPLLDRRDEYLSAFAPSPTTSMMYAKHLGWIFAGRKYQGIGDPYRKYEKAIDEEALNDDSSELYLQACLQNARRAVARELSSDALEALFMACCEGGAEKDYPEPFRMRASSFHTRSDSLRWRICAN